MGFGSGTHPLAVFAGVAVVLVDSCPWHGEQHFYAAPCPGERRERSGAQRSAEPRQSADVSREGARSAQSWNTGSSDFISQPSIRHNPTGALTNQLLFTRSAPIQASPSLRFFKCSRKKEKDCKLGFHEAKKSLVVCQSRFSLCAPCDLLVRVRSDLLTDEPYIQEKLHTRWTDSPSLVGSRSG